MSLNLLWRFRSLQALQLDTAHTVLHWPLLYPGDLALFVFHIALLLRGQMKAKCADTFISTPLQMVPSTRAPVKFFCSFFLIFCLFSHALLFIYLFF